MLRTWSVDGDRTRNGTLFASFGLAGRVALLCRVVPLRGGPIGLLLSISFLRDCASRKNKVSYFCVDSENRKINAKRAINSSDVVLARHM